MSLKLLWDHLKVFGNDTGNLRNYVILRNGMNVIEPYAILTIGCQFPANG